MIIYLNPALFSDSANFKTLNHLFVLLEESIHHLYLDVDISETEWVEVASKFSKELCEVQYTNSAWDDSGSIKIKVGFDNNIDKNEFSLADGYVFLKHSPLIFVENNTSDFQFLNAIFNHFPESKNIKDSINNRCLDIRGAGGKNEITKSLSAELRKFGNLALDRHHYLRAIVIVDSDKKYPDQSVSDENKEIIKYCEKYGFEHHILEKREIENYVPLEAFEEYHNTDIFKAYSQLSEKQQYYYDLEKGFNGKNIKQNTDENFKLFFTGIDSKLEGILRGGFMRGIEKFKAKTEIPKLFKNRNVNRQTLLNRCRHQENKNEYLEIINKIEKLL